LLRVLSKVARFFLVRKKSLKTRFFALHYILCGTALSYVCRYFCDMYFLQ
jgi:hypothetical protein